MMACGSAAGKRSRGGWEREGGGVAKVISAISHVAPKSARIKRRTSDSAEIYETWAEQDERNRRNCRRGGGSERGRRVIEEMVQEHGMWGSSPWQTTMVTASAGAGWGVRFEMEMGSSSLSSTTREGKRENAGKKKGQGRRQGQGQRNAIATWVEVFNVTNCPAAVLVAHSDLLPLSLSLTHSLLLTLSLFSPSRFISISIFTPVLFKASHAVACHILILVL